MKKVTIGLNGFGRIGRILTRIAFRRDTYQIAHINTRKTKNDMMAYLLKYDSVYRTFEREVKETKEGLEVDGQNITTSMIAEPQDIPWGEVNADIVVDATGAFVTKEALAKHLHDTVKKVIVTAPAKDKETSHVVLGVNELDWKNEQIISNASCTTNCSAPIFSVLHKAFGVEKGFLNTIHSYTSSQSLLDNANKKPDRSRAAALNMIPSTTGAANAVVKVVPELAGKLDGISVRVPTPTGSFTDVTAIVKKYVTVEEVNAAFKKAAEGSMKGILGYTEEPIVSSDILGSHFSSIFAANHTRVIGGNLVKVFAWYDNEWGYTERVADLIETVSTFI
ncbi:type I glyceraldehyde-3-phosphate dehydrogenase [Candidatus Woesebacteria bacterium]|nr:type I glyceraldehyde-3-phosphate dehydrogenase [Candidatus Woesebacteria bacterium]